MKLVIHVIVVALALLLAAEVIPGIEISSFYIAVIAAVVIGLLNLLVRPVLFILTLPLTLVTFWLFAFVLNTLMVLFAASFIEGFSTDGFIPSFLCSLFVSVASVISDKINSD